MVVAANGAFHAGLHTFEDIANRSVAITSLGSVYNYQLGRIAELKKFKLNSVIVKPMHTLDAVAAAVIDNRVDGALLPSRYGRSLLASGQAQIVGWYSELDEQQLGALFASAKTLKTRAKALAKFMRSLSPRRRGLFRGDVALRPGRQTRLQRQVAQGGGPDRALRLSRHAAGGRRHGGRAGRLLYGPEGPARPRRRRAPVQLVQGAGAGATPMPICRRASI